MPTTNHLTNRIDREVAVHLPFTTPPLPATPPLPSPPPTTFTALRQCYYNNQVGGSLAFGLGSDAEMCIDFLYYYPRNDAINEHCGFKSGGSFDGKNIANTQDTVGAFGKLTCTTGRA